jgi:hypothetical protein
MALSNVYPRLGVHVNCRLAQPTGGGHGQQIPEFELQGLEGELRFQGSGEPIGSLFLVNRQRPLRSAAQAYDQPVQLACDLDYPRLAAVERERNGGSLRLLVALWPHLVTTTGSLHANVQPFGISIPQEVWTQLLERFGFGVYDIVEVRFTPDEGVRFRRALEHVREARAHLDGGRYDDAVGACRPALDAMFNELPAKTDGMQRGEGEPTTEVAPERGYLQQLLSKATDDSRGERYAKLFSDLRNVTHLAHKTSRTGRHFSRAEALFVVRTTINLLALVGELTHERTA